MAGTCRRPTGVIGASPARAPGSSLPSGFGSAISICSERVATSIASDVRVTVPSKVRPGSSACATLTCWPTFTCCAYACGTCT